MRRRLHSLNTVCHRDLLVYGTTLNVVFAVTPAYHASPANSALAVWPPEGSPGGIAQVTAAQPSAATAADPMVEPFTLNVMDLPGWIT
jgi:hypothetical protein